MRGQRTKIDIERAIAEFAERQDGAVSHIQLVVRGASPRAIEGARKRGVIEQIHRGVFIAASTRRTRATLRWAAGLALQPDGAVSHDDAAGEWGFLKPITGPVHVTVPGRRKARRGIHLHRALLHSGDWVRRDGLRVTMPARTLIDLAASYERRPLQLALDEAHFLGLVSAATLAEALERNRGRPGTKALRHLLRTHELGTTRTTTNLEEHVFVLLTQADLGRFVCQRQIGPYTVDFLYTAERLVVEADGANAHRRGSRRALDAERDADLRNRGYETVRIAEAEAHGDPRPALDRVRLALSRSGP